MFIRRKPNKSGSFSVQVLDKRSGRNVLLRSFGSSKDETELLAMEQLAADFIACYGGQGLIDFEEGLSPSAEEEAEMFFSRIIDVRQDAPRIILSRIYDGIGFGAIGDDTLRSLSIARVCEPKSKVATVEYLKRCFREDYRLHQIYRYMDTLYNTQRELILQISVEHTRKLLAGRIGIAFYDVTTLYFETAREDVLRSSGFSKDGKTAESQIVLGLLVSRDGYPLSYNIFNGAQYEGRTMIPIIDDFVQRFSLTDIIIVADAGLLSRKNIALLKQAGYKFILGGRIKKESKSVQDWVLSLEKGPKRLNETIINGDERIIVSYSEQRAVKDRNNRDKGIQRLRKAYSSGKIKKQNVNQRGYNKFLVIENDVMVSIDEAKIAADAQWDGLKSYVTNTDLPASEVLDQYHGLWVVERAFRITKGTLEARPIFHFTERRIEAHICICFVAYKLYKELERMLRLLDISLSVDKVLDIAKTEWQKATATPRAWLTHQKNNYQLHAKLTQIEGIIKAHLAKTTFDREALDMDVRYISEPEKVDAERRAKEEAAEAERKAIAKREAAKEKARLKAEEKKRLADEKNRLIWPFLIQFVDDIKSGARKIGSDDYAPGTCKAWKSFIGVYEGFDPMHRFEWTDIDRAFVSRYINYLQKHGYMAKVVNKHLTNLKALINAAFIDGIHDNQRAASLIVKKKIEDRDKAVEIYLTEDELQALYEMPLTGKNDHIRDVFLIGCYTCQRVSDYNNLNADNFETTRKGTRIIRLVQQKTKTEVTIPILNENLIAICEKYGYNIPKANEQVLNRYIKNILKELSEKVPSLKEKVPTKLTMKQKEALRKEKKEPETDLNGNVIVPHYECVTSHTARRTGITNMYLSHKYTILQMMHVSGHKTQKTFMDYIKLSSEEIADEIAAMSKKENDMW